MRALAFLKNVPIHQKDLKSPWSQKQTREGKNLKPVLVTILCGSSADLVSRGLCFRLSFQRCVFSETLERYSVSPLKLGCLVSRITKAVSLQDKSQAGLLPIRKDLGSLGSRVHAVCVTSTWAAQHHSHGPREARGTNTT